jgi:hypothetical protein
MNDREDQDREDQDHGAMSEAGRRLFTAIADGVFGPRFHGQELDCTPAEARARLDAESR